METVGVVILLALNAYFGTPGQPDGNDFVNDNLRETLYHEIGHAVIDQEDLPIFGQEEDAADVFSALLIGWLNTEDDSRRMVRSVTGAYRHDAGRNERRVDYADVHGPDMQRFYNLLCLYYGAAPERRAAFASDLGLPENRQDSCEDEFAQAHNAWTPVFNDLRKNRHSTSFELQADDPDSRSARVLQAEIKRLNRRLHMPHTLIVRLEPCEEANAYYDHDNKEILFCTELAASLAEKSAKN